MSNTDVPVTTIEELFYEETQGQEDVIVTQCCFIFIAILGFAGNSLALVVFYKVRDLHLVPNILIAHQSFVDLILSIAIFLSYVPPGIDLRPISFSHLFLAKIICKIWRSRFAIWSVLKVSTVNLVILTIKRYIAVVYPIKYRQCACKCISRMFVR